MVGDAGIYLFDFRIRGWFGFDASIKRAERCHVHYVYTSSSSSSSSPVVKVDKSRKKQRAFVSNVRYIIQNFPPSVGKILTNGSHQICSREIPRHVCTSTKFALVRGPKCTPKVPNFGFGSHPCIQRETKKTRSREREKGSRSVAPHANFGARKGEERERARGFNHEEVQREFVSKLTRYEYTSSSRQREWCRCRVLLQRREKTQELCFPVRR